MSNYKQLFYSIFTFVFILLTLTFNVGNVNAQAFSLSQSPEYYYVIAHPGSSLTLPFTLTNSGDPIVLKLVPYQMRTTGSDERFELSEINLESELAPQVKLVSEPFLAKTAEMFSYNAEITVPETVTGGDFYFTVMAESEPNEGFEDVSTINVKGRVGSVIFMTVTRDGALDQKGSIALFDTQIPSISIFGKPFKFLDSYQKIPLILTVVNKGENVFQAQGTISIKSNSKKRIDSSTHFLTPRYITSNSQITLQISDDTDIKAPFFGFMTAKASVYIGHLEEPLTATTSYIVLPIKYTIWTLTTILIVGSIFLSIKRHKKSSNPKRREG